MIRDLWDSGYPQQHSLSFILDSRAITGPVTRGPSRGVPGISLKWIPGLPQPPLCRIGVDLRKRLVNFQLPSQYQTLSCFKSQRLLPPWRAARIYDQVSFPKFRGAACFGLPPTAIALLPPRLRGYPWIPVHEARELNASKVFQEEPRTSLILNLQRGADLGRRLASLLFQVQYQTHSSSGRKLSPEWGAECIYAKAFIQDYGVL